MFARVYAADAGYRFKYLEKAGQVMLSKMEDDMTLNLLDATDKIVWQYSFKRSQPYAMGVYYPQMLEIYNCGANVIMLHFSTPQHAIVIRDNLLAFWRMKASDIYGIL